MTTAVIVDAVRTAGGKRNGKLRNWHAVDLASEALRAVAERNTLDPALVDDVIMGCVMQVSEQSLNIGRNAVLAAGWPESVPATTIDRQCGSSQQAMHFAAQGVMAGAYDIAVAAGVESMTRTPMGSSVVARPRLPLRPAHDGALRREGRPGQPGHRRRDDRRPVGHLTRGPRRLLGAEPPAGRPGHRRGPLRERDRARRRPRRRGQRHRRAPRRPTRASAPTRTRRGAGQPEARLQARAARSRRATPRRSPTAPRPCSS